MARIIEIRTYTLHPGAADEYERLFDAEAAPMLARHGIDVVAFGSSIGDPVGYYLIRAFDDLGQRGRHIRHYARVRGLARTPNRSRPTRARVAATMDLRSLTWLTRRIPGVESDPNQAHDVSPLHLGCGPSLSQDSHADSHGLTVARSTSLGELPGRG